MGKMEEDLKKWKKWKTTSKKIKNQPKSIGCATIVNLPRWKRFHPE
jgi:hypothetical protein